MKIPKLYAQNISKSAIDLTLSINPLGCSPLVLKTLRNITQNDISFYPSTDSLVKRLAERFRIEPENILLGNGSEQLIKLIAQTFITPGDRVLIERGSFGLFTKESLLAKAKVTLTTLDQITKTAARLVFIANPKTPTGEMIPKRVLRRIQMNRLLGIIVVDEANGELMNESSIEETTKSSNILVLRTFSKTFGLAGVRIGCVVGPKKLVRVLRETQQPFPVSQIAVKLAQAALNDGSFITKIRRFITQERNFLQKELKKRSLRVSDSVTNNIFVSFPKTDRLIQELNKRGVSVINGTFFPGMKSAGFRISLKDRKTNLCFLKKLDEALCCLERKKLLGSKEAL